MIKESDKNVSEGPGVVEDKNENSESTPVVVKNLKTRLEKWIEISNNKIFLFPTLIIFYFVVEEFGIFCQFCRRHPMPLQKKRRTDPTVYSSGPFITEPAKSDNISNYKHHLKNKCHEYAVIEIEKEVARNLLPKICSFDQAERERRKCSNISEVENMFFIANN